MTDLTYRVVPSSNALSVTVVAIDYENEGGVYVVLFSGPNARERAEEYAAFKSHGTVEPSDE